MTSLYRASNKAPVKLGTELGRGGEGVVSEVADEPELVAKVYFVPADPRKSRKLRVLAQQSTPQLQDAGAWPLDVLLDASGATRGVLMLRLDDFGELHELYTPKSRRQAFPDANFGFIVQVAESLARAVGLVHSLGHVIGDLNHGNAVVARDGRVRLIDCDSFQVRDAEALYTCDVGVALFTPPELQGRLLRGLERSADHDAFGLAVLLFHLLYLGRHPFAGRTSAGDMTIEQAIAEGRFAYGAQAVSAGVIRPPGTLSLDSFGNHVAMLFERAFSADAAGRRPAADEWSLALRELQAELQNCENSEAHLHPRARDCCWCEIETRTVRVWFGDSAQFAHSPVDPDAVEKLWRAIRAVPLPELKVGPPPRQFLAKEWELSRSNREAARHTLLWIFGLCWMGYSISFERLPLAYFIVGFGVGFALYVTLKLREREMEPEIESANAQWLEDRITRVTKDYYSAIMSQLEQVRARLMAIRMRPVVAIPDIIERHTSRQRQKHLATLRLSDARIPDLTRDDRKRLAALGVTTAAGVLEKRNELHYAVRYATVRELHSWAQNRAAEFVLDPSTSMPTDPQWASKDMEAVVAELMGRLAEGPELLRQRRVQVEKTLDALNRRARGRLLAREMP